MIILSIIIDNIKHDNNLIVIIALQWDIITILKFTDFLPTMCFLREIK